MHAVLEPVRPPVQLRSYTGYVGGPILKNAGAAAYGARWEQDERGGGRDDGQSDELPDGAAAAERRHADRTTSYSLKSDAQPTHSTSWRSLRAG